MARSKPRVVVIYNRDFEGADADPENKAREDVKEIAVDVLRILAQHGYETAELGITHDVSVAMAQLRARSPDVVFNLCESIHGDNRYECLMPLLLELEQIRCTGSGGFALALALRKEKVKDVLRGCGIPTPWGRIVTDPAACPREHPPFPLIVKPAREDASVGISCKSVVNSEEELRERLAHVLSYYRQPALVEQFIHGREIYVSLLGCLDGSTQIFPFYEIDFSDLPAELPRIVSFEGKWVEDSPEFIGTKPVPCAGLSPGLQATLAQTARAAFQAIGLRDYARVDFRLSPEGIPYVIDVNPNCDLSDLAGGFSRAAKAAGLTYPELILRLVELALARRSDDIAAKA
jgi:D-alanine-D-alanine ligase